LLFVTYRSRACAVPIIHFGTYHTAVGADAKAKTAPLLAGKTANLPAAFRVLAAAGVAAALNATFDTYVVSAA
jgi:hypothetical protein